MKKLITIFTSLTILLGISACVPVDPGYNNNPGINNPHRGYRKVIVHGEVYYIKNGNYYQYRRGSYSPVSNPHIINRPTPTYTPNPNFNPRPTKPVLKPTKPVYKPKPKPTIPFKPKPLPSAPPRLGS